MTLKSILKTTVAVSIVVGVGFAGPVGAVSVGTEAEVTIVDAIVITQDDPLRFGNIQKPSDSPTSFTISAAGVAAAPTGGNGLYIGPPTSRNAGKYDVNGTDSATYAFSVASDGTCSDPGLSLTAMTHDAAATLDDLDVGVGGTLTVGIAVAGGPQTCDYTVTANYS